MSKNLDVSYKATSNEEMIENTQRQKSILEILLSKNEADYYYKKAEEKKKKIEANPLFS
tara:strand:- start:297 stop:473 length:177 start_codon:yes stop_codon:yes gene_type:complete